MTTPARRRRLPVLFALLSVVAWALLAPELASAQTATLIAPANGATAYSNAVSFSWTSVSGALRYYLYVGTTAGASNVTNTGEVTYTALSVGPMPIGRLYARLWTKLAAGWVYSDSSFTVLGPTRLVTPANGAILNSTTAAFAWTTIVGALDYYLYVGTARSLKNLVNSGETTATSLQVNSLPAGTLYVRLWTKNPSDWVYSDTAFTVSVPLATTLAARYPGDIGIDADPAVVWHENFAETGVSALAARYDDVSNSAGMTLVADVPATSSGQHAVQMVAGGAASATHLYKSFGAGYDELYYRYYVKYSGAGPWHHSGLWFGGYNPALSYPYPRAGLRPTGNDRFSIAVEPQASVTDPTMDFYAYWTQMHSWRASPSGAPGDYWGNSMIHSTQAAVTSNAWTCFEVHLKLNPDPTSDAGAVLEIWENDFLVRRFDGSGPLGYWVADKFCPQDATGTECTKYRPANPTRVPLDQQWRSTTALKINNIWLQNYNDNGAKSSMLYDDVVVATTRIGCTVKK